jgi:predicted permease
MITLIGVIVPLRLRVDWRQEWEAELRNREAMLEEWDRLDWRSKLDLLWRSASAFWDALFLQPQRLEDEMFQDLRFGARMLFKHPSFTLIAVLTLGLGIGVNTALFTMFNTLLRPIPVKDPDAVVRLGYVRGDREGEFSYPDYDNLSKQTKVFSGLVAQSEEHFLLGVRTGSEELEEITGYFVSSNFFTVLGGDSILGRSFAADEFSAPGKDPVVVLSHRFWQRHFAGDPQVIGRTITLNNRTFTVIGVADPNFRGISQMGAPDLWAPLTMRAVMPTVRDAQPAGEEWFGKPELQWLGVVGRLNPGKTLEEGRAEMELLFNQLVRAHAEVDAKDSIRVSAMSGLDKVPRNAWRVFGTVLAATGIVLLIACSNLANLLLARASARRKEIGMRLCLGAGRGRVIRQLLTESLLLAGLGGVLGLCLAWWGMQTFTATVMAGASGQSADRITLNLAPDWRILTFTFLLTLISGVAFGLAPALQATRVDLFTTIKDEGSSFGSRFSRSRLRSGLVIAQVALSLALLIPAGLLLRGLTQALRTDPGFETKKTLVVGYSLELSGYDQRRAQLFNQQLRKRLEAAPGVEAVTTGDRPFGGGRLTITVPSEARKDGWANGLNMRASYLEVTPEWFQVFGIPIIRGRGFTGEEMQPLAESVVVSEATARNLWPDEDPIGKQLRVERRVNEDGEKILVTARVIGVARDAQTDRFGEIPPFALYLPQATRQWLDGALIVRASRSAAEIKSLARAEARATEPVLRLWLNSMEEVIQGSRRVGEARVMSGVAAGLGLLALSLAAIGIYGVMSYIVAERTREIGIRMAMGANRRNVLGMLLGQGLRLVGIGAALGVVAGAAVARLLASLLFGLSPFDPMAYLLVALFLAAIATTACLGPARKATRVDPMIALRHE